ncbi:hypothetical protein AGMMS49921_10170 [Endomicrobiia bacterium]|nr:hypothetical protein AGMMS49921_10170 [Endomicrobiia bacterium]
MKKKKVVIAIVLFGLALSSCKCCPYKEDKDKKQTDILDRGSPANDASANNNAHFVTPPPLAPSPDFTSLSL